MYYATNFELYIQGCSRNFEIELMFDNQELHSNKPVRRWGARDTIGASRNVIDIFGSGCPVSDVARFCCSFPRNAVRLPSYYYTTLILILFVCVFILLALNGP